jgi:hypothetical protein
MTPLTTQGAHGNIGQAFKAAVILAIPPSFALPRGMQAGGEIPRILRK